MGLIPGWGTKILHAPWPKKKKNFFFFKRRYIRIEVSGGWGWDRPLEHHLPNLLQGQAHDVGDDDPLLEAGPALHPHQDDVVEQQ